jgi:hypothetical protein
MVSRHIPQYSTPIWLRPVLFICGDASETECVANAEARDETGAINESLGISGGGDGEEVTGAGD